MSTQLSAMLAPYLMNERLRTAQAHRDHRLHVHTARTPEAAGSAARDISAYHGVSSAVR
jgi:hypothetical protein